MKIVIATPLFPPDTAPSARYAKELAARLAKSHEVTVVAYARHPERTPGVRIESVDKGLFLPFRLASFFFALFRATTGADLLIVENGPSAELPALGVILFRKIRVLYSASDADARRHAGFFSRSLSRRAEKVHESFPPARPEILPFSPYPEDAMRSYEERWSLHLRDLIPA